VTGFRNVESLRLGKWRQSRYFPTLGPLASRLGGMGGSLAGGVSSSASKLWELAAKYGQTDGGTAIATRATRSAAGSGLMARLVHSGVSKGGLRRARWIDCGKPRRSGLMGFGRKWSGADLVKDLMNPGKYVRNAPSVYPFQHVYTGKETVPTSTRSTIAFALRLGIFRKRVATLANGRWPAWASLVAAWPAGLLASDAASRALVRQSGCATFCRRKPCEVSGGSLDDMAAWRSVPG